MITKVSKFGRLLLSQYFWKYIGDTKSTLSPHHHHHTPPQAQQRSKKPRLNRVNIFNSLLPHQPSAKSRKDQKFDCNPKHFIPIQKYSTAQIQNHIDIDEELLTGHFDPEKILSTLKLVVVIAPKYARLFDQTRTRLHDQVCEYSLFSSFEKLQLH